MRLLILISDTIRSPGLRWERAGWTVHAPRGLRRLIHTIRHCDSSARPGRKAGRTILRGNAGRCEVWPDANGRVSFLGRFLDYLKAHRRLTDFTFFSFEHYPRIASWNDLYHEPGFVSHIVQVWKDDGLPFNVPFFMTEGNMEGYGGSPDIKGTVACRLCWLDDDGRRQRYFLFTYPRRAARPPYSWLTGTIRQ
jgi:hypothetical protein